MQAGSYQVFLDGIGEKLLLHLQPLKSMFLEHVWDEQDQEEVVASYHSPSGPSWAVH